MTQGNNKKEKSQVPWKLSKANNNQLYWCHGKQKIFPTYKLWAAEKRYTQSIGNGIKLQKFRSNKYPRHHGQKELPNGAVVWQTPLAQMAVVSISREFVHFMFSVSSILICPHYFSVNLCFTWQSGNNSFYGTCAFYILICLVVFYAFPLLVHDTFAPFND